LARVSPRSFGERGPASADSDAEEVVADVLVDAWFRAGDIDLERGSLETWLAMRARFRTLDRLRAARRRQALGSVLARLAGRDELDLAYPSDLDAYLAGLGERDRRLVQLRFLDGRPVAEVAAICSITPKAAERRLARLRIELRRRCADIESIGEPSRA